jgi:hypothetical protein
MTGSGDGGQNVLWNSLDIAALELDSAWIAAPHERASTAAAQMKEQGFDVAPIDGRKGCTHFVSVSDLQSAEAGALVIDCAVPVPPERKASVRTPLGEVLQRVLDLDWLFATDALGGIAVVSIADIARPAFTAMALSTVLGLEQRLNEYMELFDDADILARCALSKGRVTDVERLIRERRERRQELSFVQSLSLEHRFDIILHFEPLWAQIASSKASLRRMRTAAQTLRNTLAHGGTLLDVDEDGAASLRLLFDLAELSKVVSQRVGDQPWTSFAFADVHLDDGTCLAGDGAIPSLDKPLLVITAENPGGIDSSPELNAARTLELIRLLDGTGLHYRLGMGGRGAHWERSVVVDADLESAIEIATAFQQIGIFRLTQKHQEVVRLSDGEVVRTIPRVRRHPDRVRGSDTLDGGSVTNLEGTLR